MACSEQEDKAYYRTTHLARRCAVLLCGPYRRGASCGDPFPLMSSPYGFAALGPGRRRYGLAVVVADSLECYGQTGSGQRGFADLNMFYDDQQY